MKLTKFNSYSGGNLKGTFLISTKLDGVCVDNTRDTVTSKRGKTLYNLNEVKSLPEGFYEFFRDNWETSTSIARTHDLEDKAKREEFYMISPSVDVRLYRLTVENPTETFIYSELAKALAEGNEGLVLYPLEGTRSKKPIKVKPTITVDIRVTGIVEGTGQFKCMLGKFITEYGGVGTGFSHDDRYNLFHEDMVGEIIEVEAMEWTSAGKLRHARFKRWRWDKSEENLERDQEDDDERV